MEKYLLDLGKGHLNSLSDYAQLESLADHVVVVDIFSTDSGNESGRPAVGIKLVGLLMANDTSRLFGVRFKEDSFGEHIIFGERYRKFSDIPEKLLLTAEDFSKRNAFYVLDSDRNYQAGFVLKGIIEGL